MKVFLLIVTTLTAWTADNLTFGQENSQTEASKQSEFIKRNGVNTLYIYRVDKKDTLLIASQNYTMYGLLKTECYFENGQETIKRIFNYDSTDKVKRLVVIKNQSDTSASNYSSTNPYIEILLGGIPDYFPTTAYFENGLLKTSTALTDKGEVNFIYKYNYYKAIEKERKHSNRTTLGEKWARTELKNALIDTTQHNVINSKFIILDSKGKAIKFAEQILFDIYGKKQIKSEKPYEVYNIDNYWVICGTLPKDWKGGTFLIIINSQDCKVLRITHGK